MLGHQAAHSTEYPGTSGTYYIKVALVGPASSVPTGGLLCQHELFPSRGLHLWCPFQGSAAVLLRVF